MVLPDAKLMLVVRRFTLPERRRRQHSDGLKGIEDQQIPIAGDNRGALAGARRRQHNVVINVATNRRFKRGGCDERERFLEQANGRSHIRSALMKLSSQHVSELVPQWAR